jgi:hypothetical protein
MQFSSKIIVNALRQVDGATGHTKDWYIDARDPEDIGVFSSAGQLKFRLVPPTEGTPEHNYGYYVPDVQLNWMDIR